MGKFKSFVSEMTMKAGNLDNALDQAFDKYKNIPIEKFIHIGDITDVKVMRYRENNIIVDLLIKDDKKIGFTFGNLIKEMLEICSWYIIPEERRQDLGYKYLYFLKNVLQTKILMGSIHSKSTQDFLKKQHNLKRFEISWYNVKTQEKEPFDNDINKYGIKETDWQVLIENDLDHQTFNQFRNKDWPSLKDTYIWLFDGIENI